MYYIVIKHLEPPQQKKIGKYAIVYWVSQLVYSHQISGVV